MLGCNCHIFQKTAIYNDWRTTNKWQCYLLKLKDKNCQNIKRLSHSFLYFEGKMHLYLSFNLHCTHFYSVVHNATLSKYNSISRKRGLLYMGILNNICIMNKQENNLRYVTVYFFNLISSLPENYMYFIWTIDRLIEWSIDRLIDWLIDRLIDWLSWDVEIRFIWVSKRFKLQMNMNNKQLIKMRHGYELVLFLILWHWHISFLIK